MGGFFDHGKGQSMKPMEVAELCAKGAKTSARITHVIMIAVVTVVLLIELIVNIFLTVELVALTSLVVMLSPLTLLQAIFAHVKTNTLAQANIRFKSRGELWIEGAKRADTLTKASLILSMLMTLFSLVHVMGFFIYITWY